MAEAVIEAPVGEWTFALMPSVSTHLMFQGDAEAAMDLYASVFSDFRVVSLDKYGLDDGGPEGTIKIASVDFKGQRLIVIDSPISHDFGFTPAISLFVDFETAAELDRTFAELSDGGSIMMPLDNYGFSSRFGWLADRFGVSWQLNLPHTE